LQEIKLTHGTIYIVKQMDAYKNNSKQKVYLKDINIDDYVGDERQLAYYGVRLLHMHPDEAIPLLWKALSQQYKF